MTDLKNATVQGVTALIDKAATEAIAAGVTMPPAMLAAYEAVIGLIERKSPSTAATMDKVRQAVGLPVPDRKPSQLTETLCPTSPTTQAKSASASPTRSLDASSIPETPSASSPPSLDAAPPSDPSGRATS